MRSERIRILIINPNSGDAMTAAIQRTALAYADGDFLVDSVSTPGAPEYVNHYLDAHEAAPGMLRLVKDNEDKYDAFIIGAHCDPNLDLLKEVTKKPVVGMGEASMKIASMLGHSFSVVSAGAHSIPNKEFLISKYNLAGCSASVRAPKERWSDWSETEVFYNTAKAAVEEDLAEVIVLGSGGMCGLDKKLSEKLGVPVLDGIACALMVAVGLVKAGLSISKIRRYSTRA